MSNILDIACPLPCARRMMLHVLYRYITRKCLVAVNHTASMSTSHVEFLRRSNTDAVMFPPSDWVGPSISAREGFLFHHTLTMPPYLASTLGTPHHYGALLNTKLGTATGRADGEPLVLAFPCHPHHPPTPHASTPTNQFPRSRTRARMPVPSQLYFKLTGRQRCAILGSPAGPFGHMTVKWWCAIPSHSRSSWSSSSRRAALGSVRMSVCLCYSCVRYTSRPTWA